MKTLSTLALLTAATAAQAYTLDVSVGHSSVDNYDNVSVFGLGIGTHLNNEYHLGLNVARKNISSAVALVDAKATSATVDLTYSLSPGNGIRPFVGAGIGGVSFDGASIDTNTALATKLFVGIAFPISNNMEFTLTAQNSKFYSVQELAGGPKTTVSSWDGVASLRFNF